MKNKRLGFYGERVAQKYLEDKGLRVMDINYRSKFGEVDIIAYDGECIVFVEVKTRSSTVYGFPIESVGSKKRDRYYKIASIYIKEKRIHNPSIRFDIIEVMVLSGKKPSINHIPNAFRPSGGRYYL